ncbi:hypothetical protein [Sphingobacterium sp. SYP-B4668]|uniref:hypothetical protein n=1 Tax=Sphingobacterium sp. SYP-B4668 TaxID=2996035 RepID=UPI0022DD3525|nr:hypothetical protein [Sphingobacterium sp. SYP-B4668]
MKLHDPIKNILIFSAKMNRKITTLTAACLFMGLNTIAATNATNITHGTDLPHKDPTNHLLMFELSNQDTILSKKELRRIKKEKRKKMYKDLKFKIGDGVTVTTGPMKGMYGVCIYYDVKMKYLIRFTGTQQMFFNEEDIQLWIDYIKKQS